METSSLDQLTYMVTPAHDEDVAHVDNRSVRPSKAISGWISSCMQRPRPPHSARARRRDRRGAAPARLTRGDGALCPPPTIAEQWVFARHRQILLRARFPLTWFGQPTGRTETARDVAPGTRRWPICEPIRMRGARRVGSNFRSDVARFRCRGASYELCSERGRPGPWLSAPIIVLRPRKASRPRIGQGPLVRSLSAG